MPTIKDGYWTMESVPYPMDTNNTPPFEIRQLSDNQLKDLLLLYHSFEIPTESIKYPIDILQHRNSLEKEAEKRGLILSPSSNIYPFSTRDLAWESMQSVLEDENELTQSPISPLHEFNEETLMLESGSPINWELINDIGILFERLLSPQNTGLSGDPKDKSGDSINTSGDPANKSGEVEIASGDQVNASGDFSSSGGVSFSTSPIHDIKVYLKRIEDVSDMKEAKSLDFKKIRLEDLTLREKFNYISVLKAFRERFKELEPETSELYKELLHQTIWKGVFKLEDLETMSKEELLNHLAFVEESMTYNYRPLSKSKIALAKTNIEKILQERENATKTTAIQDSNNNDSVEDEEEDRNNEKDSLSAVEHQYKNSDHDTVSKALRKKLGKGDYQTIARTTTVTTVRRGKRPVVNRDHNSTTLPATGDEEDEDDETAATDDYVSKKRKRKSRSPKTRSRRKTVSQSGSGGNYKGVGTFDPILDYLHFLRKWKKQRSRK